MAIDFFCSVNLYGSKESISLFMDTFVTPFAGVYSPYIQALIPESSLETARPHKAPTFTEPADFTFVCYPNSRHVYGLIQKLIFEKNLPLKASVVTCDELSDIFTIAEIDTQNKTCTFETTNFVKGLFLYYDTPLQKLFEVFKLTSGLHSVSKGDFVLTQLPGMHTHVEVLDFTNN